MKTPSSLSLSLSLSLCNPSPSHRRAMIVSIAASPPSSLRSTASLLLLRPCGIPPLSTLRILDWTRGRRRNRGTCRAELAQDAPFAAAIGACVLNSLAFPIPSGSGPDDHVDEASGGGGAIDSTDTRFAVMGIISFIPYFNWISWVFAWLDSGKRRYLVYAAVYLAPYLRTNLSLSPEDSWLPIASILLCILHVQLEASIRNGDLGGIQFFGEARKEKSKEHMEPSAQETRDRFQKRQIPNEPKEPVDGLHHLNEKQEVDDKEQEWD